MKFQNPNFNFDSTHGRTNLEQYALSNFPESGGGGGGIKQKK